MKYHGQLITVVLVSFLALCSHNKARSESEWNLIRSDSVSDGVAILSIVFSDRDHGWALTPGELLKLSNGGSEWTSILSNPNGDRAFYALAFVDEKRGFIVGAQERRDGFTPLILQTTDGGATWQDRALDVAPVKDIHVPHGLRGIGFCNAEVGWAVGDGLIVRTNDGGKTWLTQRSGNREERLFGIACTNPERAWAVGPDGLLLRTIDAGKTWNRQEVDSRYGLVRIRFFGDDGWILGEAARRGLLLHSVDGGSTWRPESIEISGSPFDIYMDGTQGWIVGSNGTILRTGDGGRSWDKRLSPTTSDLACLYFLSPHEGWAGGAKRTLLRLGD